MSITPSALVLADGSVFEGEAIGTPAEVTTGEVVFNTALTGYQEIITDPSYAGQIITFTYPHIGNTGVNPEDHEAPRPHCRGVIVRDLARRHSNWRADGDLDGFLRHHGLSGIAGIDTRRLTRHLRDVGAMGGAFGTGDEVRLKEAAATEPGTTGMDLTSVVTCAEPYRRAARDGVESGLQIVALDFGIKETILRHLTTLGDVEVVPATTPAADVLARQPHGVFLSNGPGDPSAVTHAHETIRRLLGEVPIFGICLGHQMLATALGTSTFKLPFGHHGGNHPVRNVATGAVEITSQNHNYAVADDVPSGVVITHVNLNDGVVEGIAAPEARAFGAQHHPEAGPGPHDATYLFDQFADLMAGRSIPGAR